MECSGHGCSLRLQKQCLYTVKTYPTAFEDGVSPRRGRPSGGILRGDTVKQSSQYPPGGPPLQGTGRSRRGRPGGVSRDAGGLCEEGEGALDSVKGGGAGRDEAGTCLVSLVRDE